jgi:diguanylate cyclase (GGDEF)-like protein
MSEFLHVKTIVLFLAMGNSVAAILVAFAMYRRALRYDSLFIVSLAAQGIGWTLILLRNSIPFLLSFNIGNSLYVSGIAAEGLCMLSLAINITKRTQILFAFMAIFEVSLIWTHALSVTFIISISSIMLALSFGIPSFFLIFYASRPSLLQKFSGMVLALCSIFTIIRGVFIFFLSDYKLVDPNFLQISTLLMQTLAMLVAITGYILTRWEFLYQDLTRLASIDTLTGILNRRTFIEHGAQELIRSKRYDHSLAFLMIDVDHFKAVNDTRGHHGGDCALKSLAFRGKDVLRKTDLFGRLGGEEFAVILPEASQELAIVAAERLRSEIENMEVQINQDTFQITVSIGMTMLTAQDATIERVMQRADAALYKAKESGRNRVVFE